MAFLRLSTWTNAWPTSVLKVALGTVFLVGLTWLVTVLAAGCLDVDLLVGVVEEQPLSKIKVAKHISFFISELLVNKLDAGHNDRNHDH